MSAEYSGELTEAPAVGLETVHNLGRGLVQGFLSVTGVPDSLPGSSSEESSVQEVRCLRMYSYSYPSNRKERWLERLE